MEKKRAAGETYYPLPHWTAPAKVYKLALNLNLSEKEETKPL